MARPGAEHHSEGKTGLPGADAPVDVFEGKEVRLVQQPDPFERTAMEHEDRARERIDGNNALFILRSLSVGFEPHAAEAQVDAHASRFDSTVSLSQDHGPDRRKRGVGESVSEEPEAFGLQHGVAVEKEHSVATLRQKLLQSPVHASGETAVLRETQVLLIRGDARSNAVLDDQDAGARGAGGGRSSSRIIGATEVENHDAHAPPVHRATASA
jgi:hypothetical protein